MSKVLLIDDMRDPSWITKERDKDGEKIKFTNEEVVVARTYVEGMKQLTENGPWDILLLDHDLGTKETGNDVFVFLEEHTQYLPKQIVLVTANASAGEKMYRGLQRMHAIGLIEDFDWRRD